MKTKKPIYKLVDCNGRVYLPKELRNKADIECGDIVRLDCDSGVLTTKKVYLIEIGDKSAEAAEEFMIANFRQMALEKQLRMIGKLHAALPQE